MTIMYIAHLYGKGRRKEYTSQPHETRKAAAEELFTARPTAKQCSTYVAFDSFTIKTGYNKMTRKTSLNLALAEAISQE
jgi:hypothetical protein